MIARINKWDYIKLKSLCAAKETVNKMKREIMEWEKIFASHLSDKGFKWAKNLNKCFTKKTYREPTGT